MCDMHRELKKKKAFHLLHFKGIRSSERYKKKSDNNSIGLKPIAKLK